MPLWPARPRSVAALALAALVAPALPAGSGSLEGRLVTFTVMTWDDRATPYLEAKGRTVMVGDGVEFGLDPEGLIGGLDVVPARIEIGPERIEVTWPDAGAGRFYEAEFNGYVLRFDTECVLFEEIRPVPDQTTLSLRPEDIFAERGTLFINVAGMDYDAGQRLTLDLSITDCPIS